jgi:hypothetical protein
MHGSSATGPPCQACVCPNDRVRAARWSSTFSVTNAIAVPSADQVGLKPMRVIRRTISPVRPMTKRPPPSQLDRNAMRSPSICPAMRRHICRIQFRCQKIRDVPLVNLFRGPEKPGQRVGHPGFQGDNYPAKGNDRCRRWCRPCSRRRWRRRCGDRRRHTRWKRRRRERNGICLFSCRHRNQHLDDTQC